MKLYVVRHGETDENIGKILQGNMDTCLNENGIRESLLVRDKLSDVLIDLIITSPKQRAFKTAHIISNHQIPIILDDRLLSRNHGEFEGKSRQMIDLSSYWDYFKNVQYEKAECVKHLYDRVVSLIDDIRKKYYDKTVLLVTHSGVCRILYYYFNGIPVDGDLQGYESYNCSIELYELEEMK